MAGKIQDHLENNGGKPRKIFPCDQCEYIAKRKHQLKEHKEARHDGVIYPCDLCPYTSKSKKYTIQHRNSVHLGIQYACDQCDKVFAQAVQLKNHTKSIHDSKKFACGQCGAAFGILSSLKRHENTAHNLNAFYCTQCDYVTGRKDQLRDHIKSRQGIYIMPTNMKMIKYLFMWVSTIERSTNERKKRRKLLGNNTCWVLEPIRPLKKAHGVQGAQQGGRHGNRPRQPLSFSPSFLVF